MNFFEIILEDGNTGLINLDHIIDIWKDPNDDYATILQSNGDELEISNYDFDRLRRALDFKGHIIK